MTTPDPIAAIKKRYPRPEDNPEADREGRGDYYALGIHFVLSILLPGFFGMWLDDVTGLRPLWMILFILLGLFSGVWSIWQKTK